MLVGEAWGSNEKSEGKPFVGPAGRMLNELLLQSGVNPDSCYFTNLINDQPPGNDLGRWFDHGIPNEHVTEGLISLAEEIELVRPNVIVPLGNWPLYAFYGQKLSKKTHEPTGILDYRGYILEARKLSRGSKIIPTVHPSYLLQGGYADAPLAILDLQRVKREALYPDIRRRPRLAIVDPRGAERETLRDRLMREGDRLCIDIEYIGSRLLCVGFAVSAEWATTIIIRNADDVAWCRSLIQARGLCAQNAMFEMGILDWHYQIDAISNMEFDTMVAAYVLNIEYPKNLGALAGMYCDVPAWWDVIDWDAIKDGRQSLDIVWEYNCIDCMVTYEIMEEQTKELATDPMMVKAFEFDMSKLPALWRMSKLGIPLDHEKIKVLKYEAESDFLANQYLVDQIAETFEIAKPKKQIEAINVKSKNQVIQLLEAVGVKLDPKKKTAPTKKFPEGQYNDDSMTLMEYYRIAQDRGNKIQMKLIEAILNTREARDMESKNLGTEWDDDGRARCIYDCTKTGTRRLSSKEFFPTGRGTNLQNKPAPGSSPRWGKRYRSTFIADPGYEFGYADLKSAEFLVVAELTQDPKMLEFANMAITGKGNVHKETAAFIFADQGITADTVDKNSPFYFLGKKTRHSGNYMVGWNELKTRINAEALETRIFVTAAEVKKMLDGYLRLHPGLARWWNATEIEARANGGLIRNLFGFPRIFHGRIGQNLPSIIAFKPQSTVGDCLNMGLVMCDHDPELKELGFQMFLNVHDSIGFQYPKSNRDEVFKRVRRNMEIPIPIPNTTRQLVIPVECEFGLNWGDLEEWHG